MGAHERSGSLVCDDDDDYDEDSPGALVRRCQEALFALPEVAPPSAAGRVTSAEPQSLAPSEHEATELSAEEEDAVECLEDLRRLLLGDAGERAQPQHVDVAADVALQEGFLETLVTKLPSLHWDGRKEMALIWSALLPHTCGAHEGQGEGGAGAEPAPLEPMRGVIYMEGRLDLVDRLVHGYEGGGTLALHSGLMLRDTFRSPFITRHVLESGLDIILRSCDVSNFDVASDAFTTLKELLRRHKKCAASVMEHNYEGFLGLYNDLLMSESYVTRRQAIKLLGELLLDRANMGVMLRFISEKDNLKLIMTLLKDPSRSIQYEAFHIFKIFVANPKRPEAITKLLRRNREKLMQFLKGFTIDKEEEDFDEEKAMLMEQLEDLAA